MSTADARAHLSKYIDEVANSNEIIHVTRHGAGAVVMISEQEWETIEEMRFWSQPENAAQLDEGIAAAETGDTRPVKEIFDEISKKRTLSLSDDEDRAQHDA